MNLKTTSKTINLKFKSFKFWKSWSKTITTPVMGKFVCESHYLTTEDKTPVTQGDGCDDHMRRSLKVLNELMVKVGLPTVKHEELYNASYKRCFTPAEGGGNIGANALGTRISIIEEIFQGNLMFATMTEMRLAKGKYLLTNTMNNRKCIIQMGYEIGPGQKEFLGGCTPEVHYVLGSSNNSILKLEWLVDQTIDLGPTF